MTSDSDLFNLKLQIKAQDGGFTLNAEGKSDKVSSDVAMVKAIYKKATALEVTFKHGARDLHYKTFLPLHEK